MSGGAAAEIGFDLVFSTSIVTGLLAALIALTGFREVGFREVRSALEPDDPGQRVAESPSERVTVPLAGRAVTVAVAIIALLGVVPEILDEYVGSLLDEPTAFSVTSIGLLDGALSISGSSVWRWHNTGAARGFVRCAWATYSSA